MAKNILDKLKLSNDQNIELKEYIRKYKVFRDKKQYFIFFSKG